MKFSNETIKNPIILWNKETESFIRNFFSINDEHFLSSDSDLFSFDFSKKNFDTIIILAELNWGGRRLQEFYGYSVLKQLMEENRLKPPVQILFASVLTRKTIFKLNITSNQVFTRKFPHLDTCRLQTDKKNEKKRSGLILPVKPLNLNEKKYNYLKYYCLLKTGIIDRLEHDLRNLISGYTTDKMKRVLQEMSINNNLFNSDISVLVSRLNKTGDEKLKKELPGLFEMVRQYQKELNQPESKKSRKSHLKVMIVEDNEESLKKLVNELSIYFNNIRTYHSGTDAMAELTKNALTYDVVITDMELLSGDFDDDFQGIDILDYCGNEHPYLVTRIVTSLTKTGLKTLTGKGLDEIIFKDVNTENIIPSFENLPEFVNKIETEVVKKRQLRKMQGPQLSWWKILTRQLYLFKINNPEDYNDLWLKAKEDAAKFIDGVFDCKNESEKLSSEFKTTKDTSDNPESGWSIIQLLLTHRLISLWFGVKKNWDSFKFNGSSNEAFANQSCFKTGIEKKSPKAYFTTFLGFSGEGFSTNNCKIIPRNLFPEEISWLCQKRAGSILSLQLNEICDDFLSVLEKIISLYDKTNIPDDISVGNALHIFENLLHDYNNGKIDNHRLSEIRKQIEPDEIDYFYDQIPVEFKRIIDSIRN
ncbi:MAG: hypothetical protein A2275_15200 [Bacteroidetes bacterium RIFOXYA12_FULL_35_11]|nr:MAG: hypothetical protein A2X01_18105 [Bacteroidetes bacterium GWF2_35_48]OFY80212.1 MAG: hypothetical protein A2275_15200 [Bacteroidetes bacterium RIFOXYA12_FULL_35_11]HBX51707.1 hypothetical protein [Bacteroidales bacterium]